MISANNVTLRIGKTPATAWSEQSKSGFPPPVRHNCYGGRPAARQNAKAKGKSRTVRERPVPRSCYGNASVPCRYCSDSTYCPLAGSIPPGKQGYWFIPLSGTPEKYCLIHKELSRSVLTERRWGASKMAVTTGHNSAPMQLSSK